MTRRSLDAIALIRWLADQDPAGTNRTITKLIAKATRQLLLDGTVPVDVLVTEAAE